MVLWPLEPGDLLLPPSMNPLHPSAIAGLVASFQRSFPAPCASDRRGETAYSRAVTEFKGEAAGWRPAAVVSGTQGMAGTKKRPLPAKWVRAGARRGRYSPPGEYLRGGQETYESWQLMHGCNMFKNKR